MWDGDEDSGLGLRADDVEEGVDTGGGAVAQVDILEARGVAVTSWRMSASLIEANGSIHTLNELGNAVANAWCSLTLTVCAHALHLVQQPLRSRDDI